MRIALGLSLVGIGSIAAPPVLTSLSVSVGSVSGGTAVTLTGTGFATGDTVTFGGAAATSVVVVSATQITCVTPAGSAGANNVVVTDLASHTSTLAGAFTYIAVPVLTSVDYDQFDPLGGETVTITGTGLTSATHCKVNGSDVTITSNTATTLAFTTPALVAGTGYTLAVTTAGGTSNSLTLESWSTASLTRSGEWGPTSYAGSPWVGAVGGNLAEATNPPATSSAVNGYTGPSFDGVNDMLFSGSSCSAFYDAASYSMACLVYVAAFTLADPGAAVPYNIPVVLGSRASASGSPTGGPAGTGASGVFRFGHHDGGWKSAAIAISTGTWTFIKVRYNGTVIGVGASNGAMATTAAGNVGSLTDSFGIGRDCGSNTHFLNGTVMAGVTAKAAGQITDANFEKIRKAWNIKYRLSL